MKMKQFLIAVLVGLASMLNVVAAPVLYNSGLWNNGGGGAGWAVANVGVSDFTTSLQPGTGATDARLRLTPAPGVLTPIGDLYATSGNFVGNLQGSGDLTVNFALTSLNYAPTPQNSGALALYFVSVNGDRWSFDLTPSAVVGSQVYYSVGMGSDAGWNNSLAPTDTFWNDLANVDEFGFEIYGDIGNPLQQEFEFSNVYFSVPEPETVWMILMVIASLALTFRRRMVEVMQGLRARVKI